MRRFIGLGLIVLFPAAIISGFAEAHVHPGQSGIHQVIAILFVVFIIGHLAINFKSVKNYLGSKPSVRNQKSPH
jgi:FtsH-binding integral membrane protein